MAPQSARESAAPGRRAGAGAAVVRWAGGLRAPVVARLYLLSALACCLLAAAGRTSFVDFHVYRLGSLTVFHSGNIYQTQFGRRLPFTYPPFAAIVLGPLVMLPFLATAAGLTAASVAVLPIALYLALRLPPTQSWLDRAGAGRLALAAAAAAIWLEPVRSELHFGQIDLLLTAAILCDLALPSTARWKGALIGLAAGIKLTPAIFIVYLLITRRYRAAATAVAAFAATVAAGFVLMPASSAYFWNGTFLNPRRISSVQSGQNESLIGAISRTLHRPDVSGLWVPAAVLVAVGGLTLAARAQRRGNEGLGFSLCAITGLLISPISWTHHWVLAVPALLLAAVSTYRHSATRRRLATITSVGAIATITVIGWSGLARYRQHGVSWLHASPAAIAFSELYVIAGLASLVIAAIQSRSASCSPG
jgi:alpha-1,2-mannosyltransferase